MTSNPAFLFSAAKQPASFYSSTFPTYKMGITIRELFTIGSLNTWNKKNPHPKLIVHKQHFSNTLKGTMDYLGAHPLTSAWHRPYKDGHHLRGCATERQASGINSTWVLQNHSIPQGGNEAWKWQVVCSLPCPVGSQHWSPDFLFYKMTERLTASKGKSSGREMD